MRERLTSDDLFSYILMLRPVDRRIILIVEGDTDYAALRTHIDNASIMVIPGYGKGIIEPAMRLVNKHAIPDVAALLDRDFDYFESGSQPDSNVFVTDFYDLDATIFFSGDLCNRMAFSLGDANSISTLLADFDCPDLCHAAANLASAVGVLRMISTRDGLNLGLRDFPIAEVMREDCRSVNLESLIGMAMMRGVQPAVISADELTERLQIEFAKIADSYDYCSGHDLAKALAIILRKRGGVQIGWEMLERVLRGAFHCSELRSTKMYSEMSSWGQRRSKRIWACNS